jgi:SMI1 / KNR4 family (SUKH-1)
MSVLTDALERIFKNLEETAPDIVDSLQAGLTHEKIDEITNDLPFALPKEIYELYQWRNGISNSVVFALGTWNGIQASFAPLEQVVIDFHHLKERGCPSNLFRIFSFIHQLGGDYYAIDLDDITHPIFNFDEGNEIFIQNINNKFINKRIISPSLTVLMYAVAECFQDAIYTSEKNKCLEFDGDKVKNIIRKYNTGNFRIYKL